LGFVDADDPYSYQSKTKPDFWDGHIVHSRPGQYSVVYRIGLGQELGKERVPYPGDWLGQLVAGVRTVNVVPDPNASTVSDQAVQTARAVSD
jgi:hypothetical protein